MTSDRPPSEIADVDERLITRLSGGLIVDIGAPDYETRMAILKAKCEERGVRFRGGVIDEVGRLEFKNVRELQGALNRLIAFQTLGGEQVDPERRARRSSATSPSSVRASSAPRPSGEFASFLTDISIAVAQHVEQWKTRLTDGDRVLERAKAIAPACSSASLHDATPPTSVESVLREFEGNGHQAARSRAADAAPRQGAWRRTTRFAIPIASPRRSSCSSARCARRRRRRDRRRRSRAPDSRSARATSSPCAPRTRRRRAGQPVQPAVHSRAERRGQDASAQRDRQWARRGDRRRRRRRLRAGAGVRRRADRRAAGGHGRPLARALSHGRARCCSTTCSSSPARSARRKSCFTSSTRSTPRASSSCSPATVRRASCPASRSACARGSRAASSCRCSRPIARCASGSMRRFLKDLGVDPTGEMLGVSRRCDRWRACARSSARPIGSSRRPKSRPCR